MRTLVSLASLLWLAACTSAPRVRDAGRAPVRAGEEFTLGVGDSARIAGTAFVVTFAAVTEDSRCPPNVTCVWEGNARAKLRLVEYDALDERTGESIGDSFIELNTSARFPQRQAVGSAGTLVLRALAPRPPVADATTYVATFFIESHQ